MTWLEFVKRVGDELEANGIEDMDIEACNFTTADAVEDLCFEINDTELTIKGGKHEKS